MPDLNIENNKDFPQGSAIKKAGLGNFLSRLFGFQRTSNNKIEFTKVDVASNQRVGQALLNSAVTSTPMSERLEGLFQTWLSDNTDKLTELSSRAQRVSQLQYMYLNDPYVNRTVALYADEACQLDAQDTLIEIETPDPRMTRDMYNLLNQWGITQSRVRTTIEQLALYGDAFWSNKVTDKGIERIIPLQQLQVTDRVEFNPTKVMELQKKKSGSLYNAISKNYLLNNMFDNIASSEDFTDIFDSKLFGFEIDSDLVVPPWCITHFRIGGESSDFWPWGTSPVLGALSPYKQTQSTITLQSLARMMSFPITLYKVKTDENMDEARQFATVNRVREAYDNIGVSPAQGNSEVYTVNTKIWMPDGLLDVDIKKPEISSSDGVEDIKLYQEREAIGLGLPKSFFGGEGDWYGAEKSGKALTQQYKPFARKVYSIQSAFLESLADEFRIHFAITGQHDFRIPFTLSMKYPSTEESEEKTQAENSSLELANNVIDMVRAAIGASDEEPLPPDIVRDIIAKYTFLEPQDIMKWTRDASYNQILNSDEEDEDPDTGFGEGPDLEGSETEGEGSSGSEEPEMNSSSVLESRKKKYQRLREAELVKRYTENKNALYFQSLRECAISGFIRNNRNVQVYFTASNSSDLMLETLNKENNKTRLKESCSRSSKGKKKKSN